MASNTVLIVQPSGTISATTSWEVDVPIQRGIQVSAKVGGVTSSPTLDIKLQNYNQAAGTWVDITGAAFVQFTAAAEQILTVYPGITAAANVSVNARIGRRVRILATFGGTGTLTGTTVAATLLE